MVLLCCVVLCCVVLFVVVGVVVVVFVLSLQVSFSALLLLLLPFLSVFLLYSRVSSLCCC